MEDVHISRAIHYRKNFNHKGMKDNNVNILNNKSPAAQELSELSNFFLPVFIGNDVVTILNIGIILLESTGQGCRAKNRR